MKKKKQSLLWQISSSTTSKVSYVFGTMHVRDRSAFHLMPLIEEKIQTCNAFASEFKLDEIGTNSMDNMRLSKDLTLKDILHPKVYRNLDRLLQSKVGVPIGFFHKHLPLMVSNMLAMQLLSSDMPHSLDQTLWNYANEQDKIMLGIETYEEQLAILQNIDLNTQIKALKSIVNNYKAYKKSVLKMRDYYEDQDIVQLYKSGKRSLQGMRKILLYNRNYKMADRIANYAQEYSIFCGIGAGHLAGKKGVLRLLKQKGFKLTPIHPFLKS